MFELFRLVMFSSKCFGLFWKVLRDSLRVLWYFAEGLGSRVLRFRVHLMSRLF